MDSRSAGEGGGGMCVLAPTCHPITAARGGGEGRGTSLKWFSSLAPCLPPVV